MKPTHKQLFFQFLRLGITAFGGPSAVAYIRKLVVDRKGWLSSEDFNDGVAFCQLIPGATAMQTSAYVGLRLLGVTGAITSFLGFGLPAFILMLFFAMLYFHTGTLPAVVAIFSGLHAVIVAIILNASLYFGKATIKNWKHILIAASALIMFWVNIHPFVVILAAAFFGWLILPQPNLVVTSTNQKILVPFNKKAILSFIVLITTILVVLFIYSKNLFSLAWLMFRVDLMAFGGGFASVPIMYHEVVEVYHWLDSQTFMNGIILGQITPGPVVITATFIGYLIKGTLGALVASFYIFTPSFLLVIGLSPFFYRIKSSLTIHKIMLGVLCSFVGLLVSVAIKFSFQIQWDILHLLLVVGALSALLKKVDILWVVLFGTILSFAFFK
jgi:chromate transporter